MREIQNDTLVIFVFTVSVSFLYLSFKVDKKRISEAEMQEVDSTLTAMPLASVPKEAAEGQVLGTVLVLVSLM